MIFPIAIGGAGTCIGLAVVLVYLTASIAATTDGVRAGEHFRTVCAVIEMPQGFLPLGLLVAFTEGILFTIIIHYKAGTRRNLATLAFLATLIAVAIAVTHTAVMCSFALSVD